MFFGFWDQWSEMLSWEHERGERTSAMEPQPDVQMAIFDNDERLQVAGFFRGSPFLNVCKGAVNEIARSANDKGGFVRDSD